MGRIPVYKYPISVTVKNENGKIKFKVETQLFCIGTYVAVYDENGQISEQFGVDSSKMSNFMKFLKRDNLKLGYTVEFGPKILVKKVHGLWKKLRHNI